MSLIFKIKTICYKSLHTARFKIYTVYAVNKVGYVKMEEKDGRSYVKGIHILLKNMMYTS